MKIQLLAICVSMGMVTAAVAADANLLPNGDFSQANQLAGWSCFNGSWNSDDAAAQAGSGSMYLAAGFNAAQCTSDCIATRPGIAYSIGGQSRVLFGSPVITLACAQDSGTSCSNFTFDVPGPAMSTASSWNASPASASGVLPNYVHSLKCKLTLVGPGGDTWVHVDNLFFTTDVVFAADFEPR